MISPETEELVAKAWLAGIPERFRFTDVDRTMVPTSLGGAIVMPTPPRKVDQDMVVTYEVNDQNRYVVSKVEKLLGDNKRVRLIA
jgi:hypothetical protein